MSDELTAVTRRVFRPIYRWDPATGVVFWRDQILYAPDTPGVIDRFRSEQRQREFAWLKKDLRGKFRKT